MWLVLIVQVSWSYKNFPEYWVLYDKKYANHNWFIFRDCIQGVGYSVLKKAYEILDKIDEDEVEVSIKPTFNDIHIFNLFSLVHSLILVLLDNKKGP